MTKNKKSRSEGKFLGMPMRWERTKIFKNLWNKEDDRIFLPKYFGVGWDLNFHAIIKRAGLTKINTKAE